MTCTQFRSQSNALRLRAKRLIRRHNVVLVGRTEGVLIGRSNVKEATDRLVAYAEAGADCLYAPG